MLMLSSTILNDPFPVLFGTAPQKNTLTGLCPIYGDTKKWETEPWMTFEKIFNL